MKVSLTLPQAKFLTSEKKYCLFRAGIGSGKSFIGAHWVKKKIEIESAPGLIAANTYKQLHNATLKTLFQVLDEHHIPYEYNKNQGLLDVCGRLIYCVSLDNYDAVRGIEIAWFWLDETRDTRREAFEVILGRLRHPKAVKLEGRLTSSPSGFDWQYEYFDGPDANGDYYEVVHGTSFDNVFLPEGYIDSLKDSYDVKMYEQEVMGKVINITQGRVYYGFERASHMADLSVDSRHQLYVGMDFNVNPMTGVLVQYVNDVIYILDEFYMMSSNTTEMAEEIKRRYGAGPKVIPDATGRALKTSSGGASDHELIRRAGLRVIDTSNPFRVDRYNAVNNLFEKKRIFIDPKCVKVIRDLEQLTYKEGSTHPDLTRDKTLGHISDALGYAVWYLNPIEKPRTGGGVLPRHGG